MSKLKKNLGLWDVVSICVGAMFSSGFFLLPGLAFAHTGPSVFLAYILSGFLILPSLLSQAELSTAMPKSGGTYFFLDRTFGPVIGCIGGLGTYFGLLLKTAFALVGIAAYLQLYLQFPAVYVSVALTIVFVVLNLVGAKESSKLQNALVALLVATMSFFILEGLRTLFFTNIDVISLRFDDLFRNGGAEFFYTIAFVFVSYSGLTKVASVAEEVDKPSKNIPLGMILSLALTMVIYGLGVFVVVGLVPGDILMSDLSPIATAEGYAFSWIQGSFGLVIVTLAALASFASTGNAGVLAASRYPLAMAKDKLLPRFFGDLNKHGVPHKALLVTGAMIMAIILFVNEEGIAKLASAFQLILFVFLNLAVIIMRESRMPSYNPGFKSPLYPWVQLLGIFFSVALLIYMGTSLLIDMLLFISLFYLWYYLYARKHVVRSGAIYYWFAALGKQKFTPLQEELWEIVKEKGLEDNDPVTDIISQADILDITGRKTFDEIIDVVSENLVNRFSEFSAKKHELIRGFKEKTKLGATPLARDISVAGLRFSGLDKPYLVVVRCKSRYSIEVKDVHGDTYGKKHGRLAMFLVSPERMASLHLRMVAFWINQAEHNNMVELCMKAKTDDNIKRELGSSKKRLLIQVNEGSAFESWIGKELKQIKLPPKCIIPVIFRHEERLIPGGNDVVEVNDQLLIISDRDIKDEFKQPLSE